MNESVSGKTLVLTTTNGTRALVAAKAAKKTLIGSFLNLSTLSSFLQENCSDLILFCAGWRNHFSYEDTMFAGALAEQLSESHIIGDDAVLAALKIYRQSKDNLFEALKSSSHFQRLSKMGIEKDLRYCTRIDECQVLPVAFEDGIINTI